MRDGLLGVGSIGPSVIVEGVGAKVGGLIAISVPSSGVPQAARANAHMIMPNRTIDCRGL